MFLEFLKANPIVNDTEAMQDVFGIIDNDKDGFVSKTDLKKRYQDCYNDIDLSLEEDRVDALFERLGKDDEEQVSYEGMLK